MIKEGEVIFNNKSSLQDLNLKLENYPTIPLSIMSNEELVRLYQDGFKVALETLIEQNKGFVNKIVDRFYYDKTNAVEREDLVQEGYIGLINAANKYNANKEKAAKFITYAYFHVYRNISEFINSSYSGNETSISTPIGDDMSVEDTIASDDCSFDNVEDCIYRKEIRKELDAAMNENNSLAERNVLKLIYGWDTNKQASYKEVADIFSCDSKIISDIELRALTKLRYSEWGESTAKELLHERVYSIVNGSHFDQNKCTNTMDIVDKYFNGVI